MNVKLGELPNLILMWDVIPKGSPGALQRGDYQCYMKYVNVKKGSVAGYSTVLAP